MLSFLWVLGGCLRPHPASPQATADAYLVAVEAGDRRALEGLLSVDVPGRDALLDRHDGRPAVVATSMTEPTASSSWITLTVTYAQSPAGWPAEHLMIGPPHDATPDDAPAFVVTPVTSS